MDTKLWLSPASPGLPWDPGEQTLINLLIIKCLRASAHSSYRPGAQGSVLQGSSSLPPSPFHSPVLGIDSKGHQDLVGFYPGGNGQ